MKLKTEIRQGDDMVVPIAAGDEFDQFNAYAHDSAYAHALVQAMDEADKNSDYQLGTELEMIKYRAAELMAQWGYQEE